MKIRAIAALLFILISVSAFGEGRIKITGYVRDADGNPLELVNVRVKNTLIGSMTNEKGYYSFSISPGDSISIIYSCLGYNKAERIIPSAQADMRLNVQMNYTSFDLGEVSVTAIRKQTTTMESLNADKIKLLPDPSGGSIESLVVTFAGVSSNNELSSQYSVRGGSYDENIVYVNGIEVFRPLLIRSGQQEGLSFINPDLTEAVNFAAGGFEARYGDKMSSVLDITYKRPKIFEGSASASLLGANAYVGSSIGKFTQVTGFRFKSGRSILGTMDTDAEYDPKFIDLQTYITYQLAPKWEINFLGNLANNNYKFTPYSRETSFGTAEHPKNFKVYFDGRERDRFQTLFGALTLKHNPNENTELGLQASAFKSKEEEGYDIAGEYWLSENGAENPNDDASAAMSVGRYHEHARNRLNSTVMNVGHYGMARLLNNTLKWGATVQMEKINDKISEWEKRDSSGYSLPQTGNNVSVYSNLFSDNQIESTRFSAYAQDAFKFRTKQGLFTLVAGVRGRRGQHGLISVAHGGIGPRPGGGDVGRAGESRLQRVDLILHGGDLGLDLLAGGVGPAALDDGGLQLGQVAGGGGIVPAGEVLPQGYDVVGDGAVQLQGGVGVQVGGQGVFQLLQLEPLGLDLGHGLQGPGAVIGGGDDLALAHLLPLLPGGTQGPGIGAESLLLPHQPAGGLHGVLRGAGIHPGGGVGVRQIPHPLDQEIEHHRRRQGNG